MHAPCCDFVEDSFPHSQPICHFQRHCNAETYPFKISIPFSLNFLYFFVRNFQYQLQVSFDFFGQFFLGTCLISVQNVSRFEVLVSSSKIEPMRKYPSGSCDLRFCAPALLLALGEVMSIVSKCPKNEVVCAPGYTLTLDQLKLLSCIFKSLLICVLLFKKMQIRVVLNCSDILKIFNL